MKKSINISKYHRRPSMRKGKIPVKSNNVDAHKRELFLLNRQLEIEAMKAQIKNIESDVSAKEAIAMQKKYEAMRSEQNILIDKQEQAIKASAEDRADRNARLARLETLENVNNTKSVTKANSLKNLKDMLKFLPGSQTPDEMLAIAKARAVPAETEGYMLQSKAMYEKLPIDLLDAQNKKIEVEAMAEGKKLSRDIFNAEMARAKEESSPEAIKKAEDAAKADLKIREKAARAELINAKARDREISVGITQSEKDEKNIERNRMAKRKDDEIKRLIERNKSNEIEIKKSWMASKATFAQTKSENDLPKIAKPMEIGRFTKDGTYIPGAMNSIAEGEKRKEEDAFKAGLSFIFKPSRLSKEELMALNKKRRELAEEKKEA